MEKDLRQIEDKLNVKLDFTTEGRELINNVQFRIARERKVILDEKKILIPRCNIYIVKNQEIDAFVKKLDDEYYIFVNSGVIEEQKEYLKKLDWNFISDGAKREECITTIIEYGFYFSVFHEYAHVYCGHVDTCLDDSEDKKAQECEADMFAMDYLVNYIIAFNHAENYLFELEQLFLAVYFLFENMQTKRWQDWYNDKLIENYYNPECAEKRKHPLSAQRMLYLYEMLNVVVIADKEKVMPVKEKIIEVLRSLKGLTDTEIPHRDNEYMIVEESIQKLKESVRHIREKISRIADVSECQKNNKDM